jgi:spermidine synthase
VGIPLFITVLLIAACGLIYELIAGTLASYLLGDSVLQFSTIIGCYLFAMGIGSALSRYIDRGLAYRFVWIELFRIAVPGVRLYAGISASDVRVGCRDRNSRWS